MPRLPQREEQRNEVRQRILAAAASFPFPTPSALASTMIDPVLAGLSVKE